jgi:hypothetical protein
MEADHTGLQPVRTFDSIGISIIMYGWAFSIDLAHVAPRRLCSSVAVRQPSGLATSSLAPSARALLRCLEFS